MSGPSGDIWGRGGDTKPVDAGLRHLWPPGTQFGAAGEHQEQPDHPHGLSLQGNRRGFLCFRWFLPERTPDPLRTRVVKLSELADL